ncbi:HIT family protein [Bdellovibrio sp. HCB288]|uniref:HIT family protein n=1 Tax=Bdellovibrio sp. HCB288 TaxID=3394355 RepID=UPI0039B3AE33
MAKKKTAKKSSSKKTTPKKSSSKVSGGTVKATICINHEIWPMERDVLFRPDRMKYVRKLIKPEGCVFCNAAKNGVSFDSLCVYKTKHSMVVLNKFPYNSGHVLVLPRRHCGDLLKLSDGEYTDLQQTIRVTMAAINSIYEPGGINLGLNHGAVAGAGIPEHLHYHMIPRWSGDLNFFPLIAETKVLVESLEQTYEKFLEYFKKI